MNSRKWRRPALGLSFGLSLGMALLGSGLHGCAAGVDRPRDETPVRQRTVPPLGEATELLPVAALPGRLVLQQHVTIRWPGGEDSFDAVLQKHAGQLLLLGLGPMSQVAFSVKLEEGVVEFENRTGREMPFRPEHLLADVQRIFYPWVLDVPSCTQCERRASRAGLDVRERIGSERIEERRFELPDASARGQVVVRYLEWADGGRTPRRVSLENEWFGYSLTVESLRIDSERGRD